MEKVPEFVIRGMLAIQEYGCLMFNPEAVVYGLVRAGYLQAAEWIEGNPARFMDALAEMGKRIENENSAF